MPEFEHIINALWLLALVPVVFLYTWHERWKISVKKQMGNERLVNLMLSGVSASRRRLKFGMVGLAIVLLTAAMLNLQKPVQQAGGGLNGLDVMIVLDVSNSMMANDVQPNRLEKARLLAAKLIDFMQGNRVGIIAFAGDAYLQLPLTTDITAARLYLQSINTSLVPVQGTNIYQALKLADVSMDVAQHQYKAVILMTDGEELDKNALAAAKELRESGVVILPVGIGTPNGATVPAENGGQKRDEKGRIVVSKLNEKLLKDLASSTNGTYSFMGETDETLRAITSELKAMDQKPTTNANMVNYKSYSHWMIGAAFLLLLLEFLLPEGVRPAIKSVGKTKKQSAVIKSAAALMILLLLNIAAISQSTKMLLRKANEAYRQNQYEQAEKMYNDVLKADPANTAARYNLGNIAYRRQQYKDAVKKYEQATAKTDETKVKAGGANNKGLSYVQEKNLPKAIESFKQSVRENPYDEEVRNNLNKALNDWQKQMEEQQKNQPDTSKKEQKEPPPPKSKINKNEAEEKLAALRQEEKKIRDKMNKQGTRQSNDKDW